MGEHLVFPAEQQPQTYNIIYNFVLREQLSGEITKMVTIVTMLTHWSVHLDNLLPWQRWGGASGRTAAMTLSLQQSVKVIL